MTLKLHNSFVVLQADQDKHCMHFPIFLHHIKYGYTNVYYKLCNVFWSKYFYTLQKIPTDFAFVFNILYVF